MGEQGYGLSITLPLSSVLTCLHTHTHTSLQVLEEKEREGSLLSQQQAKRPELLQRIQVRALCITIPFLSPTLPSSVNLTKQSINLLNPGLVGGAVSAF